MRADSYDDLLKNGLLLACALGAFACLWTLVMVRLPNVIGRELLGSSWKGARPLLVLVGLAMVARALAATPFFGLRVLAAAKRTLRARWIESPVHVVLGTVGAALAGARGAAAGVAAATLIQAGVWWIEFLAAVREGRSGARGNVGEPTLREPRGGEPALPFLATRKEDGA